MFGTKLPRQPMGGFNDVGRYSGSPAIPDGLEHTPRRKGDAQLQPVELSVTPPVQHHRPSRRPVTTPPPGLLIVRLRRGRHAPMHHHAHVGLVDPEAERGAYTMEMRSLWGFDAQVASGKLRESAGCAPQGDTQIDTLASLPPTRLDTADLSIMNAILKRRRNPWQTCSRRQYFT